MHEAIRLVGGVGRETVVIVDEARDIVELAVAEGLHTGNAFSLRNVVGLFDAFRVLVDRAVEDLKLFRDLDAFAQVTDDLVHQQDHGCAVGLGEVERAHGKRVAFQHGRGGERDHRMIAVRAPARLHIVALRRGGGKTG